MKMFYGDIPISSMKIKHYEISTNDSNLKSSDMQTGIVAYGKGKRIVGTGKAFEFAHYGVITTNNARYVPSNINVIEIASMSNPIKLTLELSKMKDVDFATEQKIATVIIDNVEYDVKVLCQSNLLKIICDHTFDLQIFYGKDNYV